MMSKFSKCPICGKKGLYHRTGCNSLSLDCRYCKSGWATHKWTVITHRNVDKCPKCGETADSDRIVWPHYEPHPQDFIDKRISQEKAVFLRKTSKL